MKNLKYLVFIFCWTLSNTLPQAPTVSIADQNQKLGALASLPLFSLGALISLSGIGWCLANPLISNYPTGTPFTKEDENKFEWQIRGENPKPTLENVLTEEQRKKYFYIKNNPGFSPEHIMNRLWRPISMSISLFILGKHLELFSKKESFCNQSLGAIGFGITFGHWAFAWPLSMALFLGGRHNHIALSRKIFGKYSSKSNSRGRVHLEYILPLLVTGFLPQLPEHNAFEIDKIYNPHPTTNQFKTNTQISLTSHNKRSTTNFSESIKNHPKLLMSHPYFKNQPLSGHRTP